MLIPAALDVQKSSEIASNSRSVVKCQPKSCNIKILKLNRIHISRFTRDNFTEWLLDFRSYFLCHYNNNISAVQLKPSKITVGQTP